MADLKTTYLGLELNNPVIAGASALTSNIQTIKRIEEAGAGALVTASLFEEQVQLAQFQLEEAMHEHDNAYSEMASMFPNIEHAGPAEHLMWVRRAKEAVDIPVIASLNAVNRDTWAEYALKLVETGADALELNFYSLPIDLEKSAASVEEEQIGILKDLKKEVKIPIAVKLGFFYTSPLQFISKLDEIGVNGFVLFNRLFQPKINIEKESNDLSFNLSSPNDYRLALRFAGILSDSIKGDICASNGVHSAMQLIEVLLAGADVVQVVSTLFRNKIEYISVILEELAAWMDEKGYAGLSDFRGRLSKKNNPDPRTYERSKYVKVLRSAGQYLMK